MKSKSRPRTEPRWSELTVRAKDYIAATGGFDRTREFSEQIAIGLMDLGLGQEFLRAVRRGRSTQKQNLRYRILREVEKLIGEKVKRRRPDRNTPDAVALRTPKKPQFELEGFLL